jgi:protoporphyrinogen/coproporphyrinogen III oxidase
MKIAIVGGGISGLSLACELSAKDRGFDIRVFEAAGWLGGKIYTEKTGGYVCEAGVNGFLSNKPATLELAERINLQPVKSNDDARRRFIYTGASLWELQASPVKFMLSNFLSVPGKLRMLAEYFVPAANMDDETMEAFAKRRVGTEFFEKLLDPMASGVYAGDPSKMSIRSCFVKVYDLERKYGGLLRGFRALSKEAKKSGKKVEAGPGGALMSFNGGMYGLIETLRERLGDRAVTDKEAKGLEKAGYGYRLHFSDGSTYDTDCVVLACPAHNSAEIIRDFDSDIHDMLKTIKYPALSVIAFGVKREKIKCDMNMFGFLIPGREKRRILGTLIDSGIFGGRAPEGRVLLRTMVGGARAEGLAMLDDDELLTLVRDELADIIGLKDEPDFIRIYRYEKAIPQYELGHYRKLEALDAASAKHKGFYLAGNAYRGIAVNDCIANSVKLAEEIAKLYK